MQHGHPAYHLLIIGYGNPLRRDDGAGIALAEQLADTLTAQGVVVQQLAVQQLLPELALTIANTTWDGVLFVDTVADSRAAQIFFHSLADAIEAVALGHHLSPQALLLYAARLYGYCPPAWLVAIPGTDFSHGVGFSTKTTQLLADISALTAALFTALTTAPIQPVIHTPKRLNFEEFTA